MGPALAYALTSFTKGWRKRARGCALCGAALPPFPGLLIFSAPMVIFSTPILPEVIFLNPGVGPANHLIFFAPRYYFFGPLGTFF